jgi:hypothetical protein
MSPKFERSNGPASAKTATARPSLRKFFFSPLGHPSRGLRPSRAEPRIRRLHSGGLRSFLHSPGAPGEAPFSAALYAGDNDLGDGRSVEQVPGWFRSLADKVAASLGPIPFGFVSVKPSPARFPIIDRIRRLNSRVRRELEPTRRPTTSVRRSTSRREAERRSCLSIETTRSGVPTRPYCEDRGLRSPRRRRGW